jgi:hypothetical protein
VSIEFERSEYNLVLARDSETVTDGTTCAIMISAVIVPYCFLMITAGCDFPWYFVLMVAIPAICLAIFCIGMVHREMLKGKFTELQNADSAPMSAIEYANLKIFAEYHPFGEVLKYNLQFAQNAGQPLNHYMYEQLVSEYDKLKEIGELDAYKKELMDYLDQNH